MKNTIALLSIDNTRTFEDKSLNELYVPGGEKVAHKTREAVDIVKEFGALTVNVFDNHPKGHILFASSYKNKSSFDSISLDEVKDRKSWDHGLSDTAAFTVAQLKAYLRERPDQCDTLWPEHGKSRTVSRELMEPLTNRMFDMHLVK
jgi:nicotinamidase-related amidase